MDIPELETSTREERLAFIQKKYRCRADCDACGICATFGGREPVVVFADYIEGKTPYREILQRYRHC